VVTVLVTTPVASFVAVTGTFVTSAPLASVTNPEIFPVLI